MNKIAIGILITTLFLAAPAFAKQKQQPLQQLSTGEIVTKMKAQLGLTDQQIAEVKPIIEKYLAQEKQLKLEEKKELGRVLTGDQMYAWNFLQEATQGKEKKKRK